ncbi:MAG TPA: S9 family peptidase, partial [Terracidiphilus sp.]
MRRFTVLLVLAFAASMIHPSLSAQSKRPMTFEDLQQMKRLGDTAVSPDGKWLAYSATTVDLGQNTKTPILYVQPIAGGQAYPIAGTVPGDTGVQFSPDGNKILFLSKRSGTQQIWLANFDSST